MVRMRDPRRMMENPKRDIRNLRRRRMK